MSFIFKYTVEEGLRGYLIVICKLSRTEGFVPITSKGRCVRHVARYPTSS